jgi:hypothetical protein
MEQNLNEAFQITIFDNSIKELSKDYLEFGVDTLIDNELVRSIPLIKVLDGFYKFSKSVEAFYLKKKIVRFLFQIKDVTEEEKTKAMKKLEKNPEYRKDFVGNLILILDRFETINKSDLLGKAFKMYLQEQISYEDFLRVSHIIDKSFFFDLLKLISLKNKIEIDKISWENLFSVGLLSLKPHDVKAGMTGMEFMKNLNEIDYFINDTGKLIIKVLEYN